jgi:hypothetical protein
MTLDIHKGMKFGRWEVLREVKVSSDKPRLILVRCTCPLKTKAEKPLRYLSGGNSVSCGCLKEEKKVGRKKDSDVVKELYKTWRWLVIVCTKSNNDHYKNYGAKGITLTKNWIPPKKKGFKAFCEWSTANGWAPNKDLKLIRADKSKPFTEENCKWVTHQERNISRNPLYKIWYAMVDRTSNPDTTNFHNYGERGISTCAKWKLPDGKGFKNFLAWAESKGWYAGCGLELDRKDNDGDYSPKNCRWVTKSQNLRNRRNNIKIEVNGKVMLAIDAVEKIGVRGLGYQTFISRLRLGWSPNKALTTPVSK